ncbi:hypothetical protein KKA47_04895 [bacterium]|nr:hypothetical protein [bacterium]
MKVFRNKDGSCYHLPVKKGEISQYVLTCGSPERVKKMGGYLKGVKELANNRGLLCLRGKYKDIEVTAVNTGMGPASVAIVLPEIIDSIDFNKFNRASIMRVGTCGALQPYLSVGDFVVASGSVRDESTTKKLIFDEYPAIPSTKLSLALLASALEKGKKINDNVWYGLCHVKDEIYSVETPEYSPIRNTRKEVLQAYKEMGTLATEMEFSVYSIMADIKNSQFRLTDQLKKRIDVGAINLVVSLSHDVDTTEEIPFEVPDQSEILEVALDALYIKSQWDQKKSPVDVSRAVFAL